MSNKLSNFLRSSFGRNDERTNSVNPEDENQEGYDLDDYDEEEEEEEEENTSEETSTLEVRIVRPKKYIEAPAIADILRSHKVVFLNFESTDKVNSTRILDYLMGAVYVLDGDLKRVSSTAWILSPKEVDISGENASDPLDEGDNSSGSGGSDFGNL